MRMKAAMVVLAAASLIGVMAFSTSARQAVQHQGRIQLSGTQTLVIEDVDYYLSGGIYLQDNAKLVIRNASVFFTESTTPDIWGATSPIEASGHSTIEVHNSQITATEGDPSGRILTVTAGDSAHVAILESTIGGEDIQGVLFGSGSGQLIVDHSTVSEIRVFGESEASIVGSTVLWAVGIDFSGNSRAELAGLRRGYLSEWSSAPSAAVQSPRPIVRIQDSTVGAWSIGIHDEAQVSLSDSDLDRIVVSLADPVGELHDLAPGTYTDWDLQTSADSTTGIGLHLLRCEVGSWILQFAGGERGVLVANSDLAQLELLDYSGTVSFEDSSLAAVWIVGGKPSLSFSKTPITRGLQLAGTYLTLLGDVQFSDAAFLASWENSTVVRTYEVLVQDGGGKAIQDATVTLYNPHGVRTSVKLTDSNGTCQEIVTYSYADRESCWRVDVSSGAGAMGTGQACLMSKTQVIVRVR